MRFDTRAAQLDNRRWLDSRKQAIAEECDAIRLRSLTERREALLADLEDEIRLRYESFERSKGYGVKLAAVEAELREIGERSEP